MPGEVQNGIKGVVWGLATGMTVSGVTYDLPQSLSFRVDSEVHPIRNGKGQTVTEIYYDPKQTITITVIPSGASLSAAKSNNLLPLPGSIVTITDADDSEIAGTYTFVSGTKEKSNTGETRLTFELKQHLDNNISAAVATGP